VEASTVVTLKKTCILIPITLSLLLVTIASAYNSSPNVTSFGTIEYPNLTLINFENDDCYKWGVDGGNDYMFFGEHYLGTPPYWTHGGIGGYTYPNLLLFERNTSIVNGGLQSAKLSVVNTGTDGTRRLEILHEWDPHSEYLWDVAWYYFPSSLKPLDQWTTFHRIIYERMWDESRAVYFQQFQISLSMMTDGRSDTKGQQMFSLNLGKGDIDNNNDGIGEEWSFKGADLYSNFDADQSVPSSWLTKEPGFQVPFGRWFKVVALVYRNMTDFNNGYIKVWIDSHLIWDVEGTRTVGIRPSILESIDPAPPDPQGYLCSGFGLYTEVGSRPKSIFVDDIIISNSTTAWLGD
jgi:hypothetical protein